jgi:hypothetical protein
MRIIFLDIDGVVNLEIDWCKESINVLNRLIYITDSKIVITSDWRYNYTIKELRNIFSNVGLCCDIIDTIDLHDNSNIESIEKDRFIGIMNYIKKHDLKNFLIIDDMDLDKFGLFNDRFVKTKFSQGLKEAGLLERCIEILKRI